MYLDNLELVGSLAALALAPSSSFVPAAYLQVLEFSPLIGQTEDERWEAPKMRARLLEALTGADRQVRCHTPIVRITGVFHSYM